MKTSCFNWVYSLSSPKSLQKFDRYYPHARRQLREQTVMECLPYLDFTKLKSFEPQAIEELRCVLHEVGFFYLGQHGVSSELIQKLFVLTKAFFALPSDEKQRISLFNSPHFRGYSQLGAEKTKGLADFKETLDLGIDRPPLSLNKYFHVMQGPNQWPQHPAALREVVTTYLEQMLAVGDTLMDCLALALGLPIRTFQKLFQGDAFALLRLLHYPGQQAANTTKKVGVGEHTDFGCLVLLLQDEIGGLEVQSATGHWLPATPIPETLIVNIGDMLSLWTHGYFKATPHRVVNRGAQARYSIPFFYEPGLDTHVSPLDLKQEFRKDTQSYSSKLYGEHIFKAFAGSFPSPDTA